ncbi:MAG: phosphate acetyltransferase [Candidatus Omnitrophica bacterium]|nr:phosphate acetyltransferase [Candidatus Omnitrophota bacterium]
MSIKDTFINSVIEKARANKQTIVLPEGRDERIQIATKAIIDKDIANIVLLGDENIIAPALKKIGLSPEKVAIINPDTSPKLEEYAQFYFELRQHKGITHGEARELMKKGRFFGTMMLKNGDVDGFVAGATHSTKDTIMPGLQIVKAKPGISLISSLFFMVFDDKILIFSDCAIIEFPSAEELAEIAIESAETAQLFGIEPRVAMLSYSTKGSASSSSTKRIIEATKSAQQKLQQKYGDNSPIVIDGELQGDAALVESVAALKCPGSPVAGKATIFIFPNIDSGNIAYKLVQRLGNADAYGPILQGMAKPVNDLSRGCIPHDIEGIVAITAVQAQGVSAV